MIIILLRRPETDASRTTGERNQVQNRRLLTALSTIAQRSALRPDPVSFDSKQP